MACSSEASAAAWPALGTGPGWRRYIRSSDSSAAIAVAAWPYAVAVRTASALAAAALLVTREPAVTTTMSATSPMLVPVIAHRFRELEMGPGLTADRVTRCPQWAEVENRTRRSPSDLPNPLLTGRRSLADSHRPRSPRRPVKRSAACVSTAVRLSEGVAGPSGTGCAPARVGAASECWCGDDRYEDLGELQAFLLSCRRRSTPGRTQLECPTC